MIDGPKLKAARERSKLSQAALAARVGAAQQLIGQLERGEVKSTKLIFKIADILGVSAHSLDSSVPLIEKPLHRMIPIVGHVGAGAEVIPLDSGAIDEVECPWSELAPSTVAVRVRGDSMAPAYYDRDLIFFERQDTDLRHLLGKECVIALEDGRRFVKQLRRTGSGEWYLHSHNAEPILGIKISWAAKVRLIQRAE